MAHQPELECGPQTKRIWCRLLAQVQDLMLPPLIPSTQGLVLQDPQRIWDTGERNAIAMLMSIPMQTFYNCFTNV